MSATPARKFSAFQLLLVAVLAGGAVAASGALKSSDPAPPAAAPIAVAPTPTPMQAGPTEHATPAGAPSAGTIVEGEVLEALDVPSYTYARVGAKGTEGTWAAFPSTKVSVGARIRVNAQIEMTNFASTTLNRTFKSIWFGVLDDGSTAGAGAPHPVAAAAPAAPVEVKKVDRAPGDNGKTVAEIWANRTTLAGKTVRVRAVVVKANAGILGATYLHVRDGSGDANAGTHDLSVTTKSTPAVGDTVLLEGVIGLDRDIGSGYKFPTILENATIVPTT